MLRRGSSHTHGLLLDVRAPDGLGAALQAVRRAAGLSPALVRRVDGLAACRETLRADPALLVALVDLAGEPEPHARLDELLRLDPDLIVVVLPGPESVTPPLEDLRVVVLPSREAAEANAQCLHLCLLLSSMARSLRRAMEGPSFSPPASGPESAYHRHAGLEALPGVRALVHQLLRQGERAGRDGRYAFGLILLDVDRFSAVNECVGQARADDLLYALARAIRAQAGVGSAFCWLGADAFGIVVDDCRDDGELLDLARRLHTVTSGSPEIDLDLPPLTLSIGAVRVERPTSPEEVLQSARIALSEAKARGGGRIRLFDPGHHHVELLRTRLRSHILPALGRAEFHLHYQPIFELPHRRLWGFEALLRWEHPEHGGVPPQVFIPVLERTGLIGQVGDWVVDTGCRSLRSMHAASGDTELRLLLNVSPLQLLDESFAALVLRRIHQHGLTASSIGLELTEQAAADDSPAVRENLEQLHRAGCTILIDDFGQGYSSLGSLARVPFHALKIDRAFVRGARGTPQEQILSRAVAQLGHALSIPLIAEGVETEDELVAVNEMGCQLAQGYLLGRPMSYPSAMALLATAGSTPVAAMRVGA